jgi:metal-dependent amidase/aminoacylase/carboxypeptidase family protein
MVIRLTVLCLCAATSTITNLAFAQAATADLPPDLVAAIRARADEIQPVLVDIRREIHMHPELSGEEKQTAALIAKRLADFGLEVKTNVGGHGVVGLLKGGKPGPVVAYRADMDAVRSPVVGDVPYKSQVPNVKHVCGHDAHVAMALGIAEVLSSLRDRLPGTFKFIFQPAEENIQGAKAMIKDGALKDPVPDVIFGVHTAPLPVGFIGCPDGVGFAGIRNMRITLTGNDAAKLDAAQTALIDSLKALSTVPPLDDPAKVAEILPAVSVKGGPLSDFIYILARKLDSADANTRVVEASLRASGPASYEKGINQITDTSKTLAKRHQLDDAKMSDVEIILPNMNSNAALVQAAVPAVEAALGPGHTIMIYESLPYFGEDFAYFQETVPGAMFYVGMANPAKGVAAFNHTPDYDIDESGIATGVNAMSAVLLNYALTHSK